MSKVTRLTLDEKGGLGSRRIHLREISGDLDAPLETVGQDLRAARLRRGDDLASVSKALKIRKDYLEALEEDRFEALPGRAYAVGFIRTYADYLGLDAGECVERFKAEIAGREAEPTPVTVIDEDDRKLPQGWKIIAGVVLLLIVYGAYHLAVSADAMLREPVEPVPATIAPQTPAPSKPVEATAPAPVAPTPEQQAAVDPNAPPVPNTPEAAATGQQNGLFGSTIETPAAPLPQGKIYGEQNRNARVVLKAHQTTRILVQDANGRVFINRTLQPGDTYQVPNFVGMTLTTPNAGAVEVDLDGAPMGFAGTDQQVMEALSLDPQSIVDRFNRPG